MLMMERCNEFAQSSPCTRNSESSWHGLDEAETDPDNAQRKFLNNRYGELWQVQQVCSIGKVSGIGTRMASACVFYIIRLSCSQHALLNNARPDCSDNWPVLTILIA